MQFENRAVIPANREVLWDFLMDIKGVSECLPGVQDVRELDPDNYLGTLKVRVGPIGLSFDGKITIVERDRENWRATMRAEGADKRAGGAVKATISMELVDRGPTETELVVKTDANVLGKIGEFGQPVMRKKADSMMQEFAQNISKRVVARTAGQPS